MTVSVTTSRADYNGNGTTTAFSVPFYFLDNTHLKVVKTSGTGVATTLVLTTDYSVTGAGVGAGGTVTTVVAPATGEKLTILRNIPIDQQTNYVANDPFPAESHEAALDKLTMIAQQLNEITSRAIYLPSSDTASGAVPSVATRANKALIFDASGNVTTSTDDFNNAASVATAAAADAVSASVNATSAYNSTSSLYSSFVGTYYGSNSADPTLDPNGGARTAGDIYFNSSTLKLRVFNGTSWQDSATATPGSFVNDTFSGNGVTTNFTLSAAPANVASVLVFIAGVRQRPTTDYTISGTTLTFGTAPTSGTNNVTALTASTVAVGVPDNDSVSTVKLQNLAVTTPKIADAAVTAVKLDSTVVPTGKHTAWVPAGAMVSRTTNGPASGTVETTTNKVMVKTLDFDAATAEYAQFSVRMPKGWNLSTVTAYFLWSNASGTGNVVWGIQAVAVSDGDAIDAAFGTAQTVTDGVVTAAGNLMQSAETSAITIAGTPAAADWVVYQVYRDAANGSDTLAVDARLHGVALIYTTSVANDA